MKYCTSCGQAVHDGRFCSSCGHPLGEPRPAPAEAGAGELTRVRLPRVGGSDTAERPAVGTRRAEVAGPPSLPPAPPRARYPLYADEVAPAAAPTGRSDLPSLLDRAEPLEHGEEHPADPARARRTPAWVPWAAAAAVLVLVAALGTRLLLGDDEPQRAAISESTPDDGRAGAGRDGRSSEPTAPASPQPSAATPSPSKPPGKPRNLSRSAVAEVPATAPPSTDLAGATTQYDAARMLDGAPTTCWRMPGDGTGSTLTFRFPSPTRVSAVGLVNGYAKSAVGPRGTSLDWYHGNRRVLAVEWVFDDGTVVRQDLQETRRPQRTRVTPVTTSTVVLRLLEVSEPGTGPARRDHTALSEVLLVGSPA